MITSHSGWTTCHIIAICLNYSLEFQGLENPKRTSSSYLGIVHRTRILCRFRKVSVVPLQDFMVVREIKCRTTTEGKVVGWQTGIHRTTLLAGSCLLFWCFGCGPTNHSPRMTGIITFIIASALRSHSLSTLLQSFTASQHFLFYSMMFWMNGCLVTSLRSFFPCTSLHGTHSCNTVQMYNVRKGDFVYFLRCVSVRNK